MSINKIDKSLRHLVDEVIIEADAIGVYLKRPYVFSCTDASVTFFDLDDCQSNGIDPWSALNECIADEAIAIDPEVWDRG